MNSLSPINWSGREARITDRHSNIGSHYEYFEGTPVAGVVIRFQGLSANGYPSRHCANYYPLPDDVVATPGEARKWWRNGKP